MGDRRKSKERDRSRERDRDRDRRDRDRERERDRDRRDREKKKRSRDEDKSRRSRRSRSASPPSTSSYQIVLISQNLPKNLLNQSTCCLIQVSTVETIRSRRDHLQPTRLLRQTHSVLRWDLNRWNEKNRRCEIVSWMCVFLYAWSRSLRVDREKSYVPKASFLSCLYWLIDHVQKLQLPCQVDLFWFHSQAVSMIWLTSALTKASSWVPTVIAARSYRYFADRVAQGPALRRHGYVDKGHHEGMWTQLHESFISSLTQKSTITSASFDHWRAITEERLERLGEADRAAVQDQGFVGRRSCFLWTEWLHRWVDHVSKSWTMDTKMIFFFSLTFCNNVEQFSSQLCSSLWRGLELKACKFVVLWWFSFFQHSLVLDHWNCVSNLSVS